MLGHCTTKSTLTAIILLLMAPLVYAHPQHNEHFAQLEPILPTPTRERGPSGAPGPKYWQQRADYKIHVTLNDTRQTIKGREVITYTNNSPYPLSYVWVQLDQNIFQHDSTSHLSATAPNFDKMSYKGMRSLVTGENFDGPMHITHVKDGRGKPLPYSIVDTMMRIDLPTPLKPQQKKKFAIGWHFKLNDAKSRKARTGYEYFKKDDNYIYEIAQWYPRMVAFTDVNGWHHKQYIGRGEFTLDFGTFDVHITVPADHIVAATGSLKNPKQVLSSKQRRRLRKARESDTPQFIVTPQEALKNQKHKSQRSKTWHFKANKVRDFAFASSRKFIWDAAGHKQKKGRVLAMSFYPNEAEPLWSKYSTQAVMHTMEVYSRFTFDYPYPVAISVNGPVGGMEYPMITFNGPRAAADGTYWGTTRDGDFWRQTKYGLISVIIHEIGHIYFPMIVNSDERQWTWMDEGINSFLQFVAEREWEENYPGRRGTPPYIAKYMKRPNQVPIMTNSESIIYFHFNGYAKPATALNILRETILGRELFDFSFKEYANRWKFKRPMPADFFRSIEDASGVDLDWFWRGWFYSTEHVDIAIDDIEIYQLDTLNPDIEKPRRKLRDDKVKQTISHLRDRGVPRRVKRFEELQDFYNSFDKYTVTDKERKDYQEQLAKLKDNDAELLNIEENLFVLHFKNIGGVVMPIILKVKYTDGSLEEIRLPAEIWRRNQKHVKKLIMTPKTIASVHVDPYLETADANLDNNHWPAKFTEKRFKLKQPKPEKNPMQKAKEAAKLAKEKEDKKKKESDKKKEKLLKKQ